MTAGRVRVNGEVVTELGSKVDPLCDVVEVDGVVVRLFDSSVTIMLNKPAGYLTTMSDPTGVLLRGKPCAYRSLPRAFPPVGRLDMDTTGLLLFSTDGELGNSLLHPRYHVDKTYHARVAGIMSQEQVQVLGAESSSTTAPRCPPRFASNGIAKGKNRCEITIHEGRKTPGETYVFSSRPRGGATARSNFGPLAFGWPDGRAMARAQRCRGESPPPNRWHVVQGVLEFR